MIRLLSLIAYYLHFVVYVMFAILILINAPTDIGALRAGRIKLRFNVWNVYCGLITYILLWGAPHIFWAFPKVLLNIKVIHWIGKLCFITRNIIALVFPVIFLKHYIKRGDDDK